MSDVSELIDRGIKAYVAGKVGEALRTFQEVLERDPGNPRARSYLLLIHGGAAGLVPETSGGRANGGAIPLPGAAPAAIRLPAPAGGAPEDFAPSPWDEGPAAAATFVLDPEGGLDLDAVAEKSDLRPLVPAREPTAVQLQGKQRPELEVGRRERDEGDRFPLGKEEIGLQRFHGDSRGVGEQPEGIHRPLQ